MTKLVTFWALAVLFIAASPSRRIHRSAAYVQNAIVVGRATSAS